MEMKISPVVAWLIRVVGLAVFAVAFLLPALAPPDAAPFIGWKCASIAFSAPFSFLHGQSFDLDIVLVSISGLLNAFLFIYVLLSFFKRLKLVRWVFIGLIFISMLSTWDFFARKHCTPLMGHFLWIAGAVIIILPEFFGSKQEG
jgi:hypothetical protein